MKTFIVAEKRTAGTELASVLDDASFKTKSYAQLEAEGKKNGFIEGQSYVISWAMGHLFMETMPSQINPMWGIFRRLPTPQEYRMEGLLSSIKRIPTPDKFKTNQRKILSSLFARADIGLVHNACDADDEGEGIFMDIYTFLGGRKRALPVLRFWNAGSYKSKVAVEKAMKQLLPMEDNKYQWLYATKAGRGNGDYLVGMKGTKTLCDHYNKPFYIGRVKGVCVGLVGDRELEVKNFVSRQYWTVGAKYKELELSHFFYVEDESADKDGNVITTKRKEVNYFTIEEARRVKADTMSTKALTVTEYESKQASHRCPSLPLSGSEFSSAMMEKYKTTYPQTTDILDYLRNEGFTTYPGTNGNYYSLDEADQVEEFLKTACAYFGMNLPFDLTSEVFNDKKAKDQNHAPLSVTERVPTQADLDKWKAHASLPNIKEAYELIAKHFMAKFLPEDTVESQSLVAESSGGYKYSIHGQKVLVPGWRTFMGVSSKDTIFNIPNISVGTVLPIDDVLIYEKKTVQPKLHTMKTLLDVLLNVSKVFDKYIEEEKVPAKIAALKKQKAMLRDAKGIGTDRTRKGILEELFKNNVFAKVSGGALSLSPFGWEMYHVYPATLRSVVFTARWEMQLEDIRNGRVSYTQFITMIDNLVMDKFIPGIIADIGKTVQPAADRVPIQKDDIVGTSCPECGTIVQETEKAFVCKKRVYKNKTVTGCKFMVIKDMSKTLGRKLSGKEDFEKITKATKDSPLSEGKNSVWYNPSEKFFVTVVWSGEPREAAPANADPLAVIETTKTFRMGERFMYKGCMGKDLSLEQAKKLFAGQTISIARTGKKGKYTAKATLKADGSVNVSF